MTRLHQISIDVIWQADRLMEGVFALRLAEGVGAVGRRKKEFLFGQGGSRGRPPFAGVGIRNSTLATDFLQKTYLGIYE